MKLRNIVFGLLLGGALLPNIIPSMLFGKVGTEINRLNEYTWEIAETLTVLDGEATGATYVLRVPGGAAVIKIAAYLNGTWAAGGGDAYFEVTMKNRYGSYTDISGNNDLPVLYDNKNDATSTKGAIYLCDDSTGAVGAAEIVRKDFIMGTHGTWIVVADSISIFVKASTGTGDWTTDTEDCLKLWVEMYPINLREYSPGP